jgi:hypothetical protein
MENANFRTIISTARKQRTTTRFMRASTGTGSAGPPTAWCKISMGFRFTTVFGSAHPGATSRVVCDGSGHSVAYTIDPTIHTYLCCRNDGKVFDKSVHGNN